MDQAVILWMMYRCGWGTKEGQQTVLAVEISRVGFEWALTNACLSSYVRGTHPDRATWQRQLKRAAGSRAVGPRAGPATPAPAVPFPATGPLRRGLTTLRGRVDDRHPRRDPTRPRNPRHGQGWRLGLRHPAAARRTPLSR